MSITDGFYLGLGLIVAAVVCAALIVATIVGIFWAMDSANKRRRRA